MSEQLINQNNENKISPNNGILLNGVLITKLLNNSLASCSLINLDFLPPHIAHSNNSTVLPLLDFETLEFMLSGFVFYFHFFIFFFTL